MKPPHGNKPGGPGRPPSDRGSFRGGGPSQRSQGQHAPGGRSQGGHPHGGPSHKDGASGGRDPGGRSHADGAQGQRAEGNRLRAPQAAQRQRDDRQQDQRQTGGFQQYRPERERQANRQGGAPTHRPSTSGPRPAPEAPRGTVWLYGFHAVAAALANPARRLRRLILTEDAEATLAQKAPQPWPLTAERVDRGRLDHLLGRDIVHQGVALLADPLAPPSLQVVLERDGPLIVLDQVTDPRNVGAIMRSAAAFGAAGVITQDRNAPEENGALAKAASGALETMPLLRAVNIARTLIALKAANVWCVGLDAAGPALVGGSFAGRRVALVLGAEGEGMRRLTRETCDEVAGLTIKGGVDSLNVSAAAAVALYELGRHA